MNLLLPNPFKAFSKPVGTWASDRCYPRSSSEQLLRTRVLSGPFCELLGGILAVKVAFLRFTDTSSKDEHDEIGGSMTPKIRRAYTDEVKEEAVRLVRDSTTACRASGLGVASHLHHSWKRSIGR
jgi:hypothetical protein